MPDLPTRKVGLVSCSGEDLPEGTLARIATRLVLEKLRPEQTVTICLPLFLAGGEGERSFARLHPTITIDGCSKLCARRGTEAHSGQVAASIVVSDVIAHSGEQPPQHRRNLDERELRLADLLASEIAAQVDSLLGAPVAAASPTADAEPSCACQGGGLPVREIDTAHGRIAVTALDALLAMFAQQQRPADAAAQQDLLTQAKIYNAVPQEHEAALAEALLREYKAHLARFGSKHA